MRPADIERNLARARALADRSAEVLSARSAYRPLARQLRQVRGWHDGLVYLHAANQRRAYPLDGARGVPDDLHVPGRRVVVDAIRALPHRPPDVAHVRGAVDADPPETIRVLIALEDMCTLPVAASLAAAAAKLEDGDDARAREILAESGYRPHRDARALQARVERAGAYNRWLADLAHRKTLVSLGAEASDRIRTLLAIHGQA